MVAACGGAHTSLAGIVHQDNLLQERVRRAVDDRVDSSQQRAPRLVVEHNDYAGAGQVIWIQLVLTPSERKRERKSPVRTNLTHTHTKSEVVCDPPKLSIRVKLEQRRREERQQWCSNMIIQQLRDCERGLTESCKSARTERKDNSSSRRRYRFIFLA